MHIDRYQRQSRLGVDFIPTRPRATGNVSITVHWSYNPHGPVDYQLEAFDNVASPEAGSTFKPSINGFRFDNNFPSRPDILTNLDPIGSVGIGHASNGFCGGWCTRLETTSTPEAGPR